MKQKPFSSRAITALMDTGYYSLPNDPPARQAQQFCLFTYHVVKDGIPLGFASGVCMRGGEQLILPTPMLIAKRFWVMSRWCNSLWWMINDARPLPGVRACVRTAGQT